MARLAVTKVAAAAGGGALVNVVAVAGKATTGDVAVASVVNASTALLEVAGSSLGLNVGASGENLGDGGSLGNGCGRDGDGEDSNESEGLGEHFWKCCVVWKDKRVVDEFVSFVIWE